MFAFFYYAPNPPGIYNYSEVALKYRFFNKNNHQLAIVPSIGLYGGWDAFYEFNQVTLGPTTGLKFIGSYTFQKDDRTSIYYGLSFLLKHNTYSLNYIGHSLDEMYPTPIPFFDVDMGLSFGWETKRKIKNKTTIFYNEISFTTSLMTVVEYDPEFREIIESKVSYYVFTFAYSFSVGGRYYMGKN
jgi:hypothetical protein